ncbi:MAG: hypothetical protein V7677_20420 [Motiliproteus sp.]
MILSNVKTLLITLIIVLLSGCSSTGYLPPSGESVDNLVRLQTERPLDSVPPLQSTAKLDGEQGEVIMEVFRAHVSKPAEINNEIHINVGN